MHRRRRRTLTIGLLTAMLSSVVHARPVAGQSDARVPPDKNAGRRHPLEGTWRLLKWKDVGAADYATPPATEIEQKTFSSNHTIWLVYDATTREVHRGAGAALQLHGGKFAEVPRYVMGPAGPKGLLDNKYESTWKIKDGRLHTWTTVDRVTTERIWERLVHREGK